MTETPITQTPITDTSITFRLHANLVNAASDVLQRAGMNVPDAIVLFFKQLLLRGGLPFDPGADVKPDKAERGEPGA
jgi:antitoxin component of RelBE/YafQ-DinJ toxin-antitoxin module